MSSIGKIFVIVNLVLALLVLGAAGALLKHTDATTRDVQAARAELESAKGELDKARSEYAERERNLNADKAKLAQDQQNADVARQTAENKAAKMEADNQQLRDDVSKINASLQALDSSFSTTQQRLIELTDQNTQLQQAVMDSKTAASAAVDAKSKAEAAVADGQREVADLKDKLDAANSDLASANKLLEVAKAFGVDLNNVMAMPRIDATVAEVDDQYGFVVLDKGRKDNVERGFTFDVHRDGQYLGRVKVDEIYDNYSTARIELKAPNAKMQRYDKASTYLN